MSVISKPPARPWLLGIEGGGTHTVALLADAHGRPIRRFEAGPGNLRLLGDPQLVRLLRSIAVVFPKPDAIAIGLAGARDARDRERIRRAAAKVWPQIPCQPTNDLETALAAAPSGGEVQVARVLVLSGTGSCCFGRNAAGKTVKLGGWGHLLGDKGSGYEIGLRGLKATVFRYDRDGVWPRLGQRLLRRLQLNEPDDLIAWAQTADKAAIASLAVEVFEAWNGGDKIAAAILTGAAGSLANDGLACAGKLARPGTPVQFVLAGSTLLKQPRFARRVAAQLRQHWPGAKISRLEREGAWGALALAREQLELGAGTIPAQERGLQAASSPKSPEHTRISPSVSSTQISPTEQRHPRSRHLDRLTLPAAVRLMLSEDAVITKALLVERGKIEQAVRLITRAFKQGGRLFYVGAGTSGRLGVLDASECPPTFRTHPDLVQGIIAGGREALWRSVEGAEDDAPAGAKAVQFRGVDRRDVVVGIAASGRTPFVWGALGEARNRGAKTVLLAFNPFLKIPRQFRLSLAITPNLGPELLTGSTRLKAGTATKLILNIFTTLAMVRLGKVLGNLMVDLNPSNVKLRDRAVRIVQALRGVDYPTAELALKKSGWVVKRACEVLPIPKGLRPPVPQSRDWRSRAYLG